MRDILSKVTTGSMIAAAALLVAACGGEAEVENTAANDLTADPLYSDNLTATDDMNMGMDTNMTNDMNATVGEALDNASTAIDNAQERLEETNAQ